MKEIIQATTEKGFAVLTAENLDDLGRLCNRLHKILKNEGRKNILLALKDGGPMTRLELSSVAGNQTSVHLDWLLSACFVCREKQRPFRYSINDFLLELLGLKLMHDEQRRQKNSGV
ncbi:MAG TPA: hypothetical protein P5080_01485 [Candidatus Paceibacterota bacterium]|nr:hypothetical protein [Candidatus Pacearchaeota archaeon]HRZ50739.1 hypothetical protein [Candidatus Paceibacterota bacterium]HSA36364.1 hypothetical protein [Candidatus Paceibacterota bacterium]